MDTTFEAMETTPAEAIPIIEPEPELEASIEPMEGITIPDPEHQPEPEPAVHPDEDGTIESQLAQEITTLWSDHVRLSGTRKATAKEIRQVRARLAERLHAMKSLLCRPDLGRASPWQGWLRQQGIPRSTADRLVSRYDETLGRQGESMPSEEHPGSGLPEVEELAKGVWQRVGKTLSTDDLVIRFFGHIAELSGVGHERREEGLMIFNPASKPADDMPVSAPAAAPTPQPPQGGNTIPAETSAAEPAPQPSCETATATEGPAAETTAMPLAAEQVAAAADAGGSDAA
jgi:hypothetical protein